MQFGASKKGILVSETIGNRGREHAMIQRMQWIFLAGVLLMIAPELPPAQEKTPQGQQAQSVEQSKGYDDLQQKMLYEKQQSDMEIQRMEARKKNEKYYNTLAFISFAITVLVVFAIIALIFFARARREKRRHELIGQYLEKGREVPRELLSGKITGAVLSPGQWAALIRWRDLRRGTWLLCLGLGIGLAVYLWSGNMKYTVWCLIILFLSAAFYINALFFSGKSDSNRKREGDA